MSEIDKILEALKRSFLYQINCELTEKQSKTLLEHIDDLHFAVNENTELNARIAELEGIIDQLTAHSGIERKDDKRIPEVQE